MSVVVVRKLSRHDGLPFLTAAEEFRDSANETTHSLLLVRLHRKSLLFPDIYYDRYGHHFTLMHDTGKGYNVGDPQVFLGALLHNAYSSGKGPSPKAKLPPAFLDRPAEHPLIDSCTREYRDWTKDFPAPAGSKHSLEEHFVWLSTSYQPYTHDPGSPFVPPDFTLGLPPVWDWPCRSGEPPWPLDPKDRPIPKPDFVAPADSTGASSPDEGKQRRKKKKHHRPRKAELKVTTRVWEPTTRCGRTPGLPGDLARRQVPTLREIVDWGPTSGLLTLSPRQGLLSGLVLMPEEILPKS